MMNKRCLFDTLICSSIRLCIPSHQNRELMPPSALLKTFQCIFEPTTLLHYSCNNITTTLIQISGLFYFGFFSKSNNQKIIKLTPIVSRSKSKCYKAQKVQKYALNSQIQALQILKNDDEVENLRLSSFLLAVNTLFMIYV